MSGLIRLRQFPQRLVGSVGAGANPTSLRVFLTARFSYFTADRTAIRSYWCVCMSAGPTVVAPSAFKTPYSITPQPHLLLAALATGYQSLASYRHYSSLPSGLPSPRRTRIPAVSTRGPLPLFAPALLVRHTCRTSIRRTEYRGKGSSSCHCLPPMRQTSPDERVGSPQRYVPPILAH